MARTGESGQTLKERAVEEAERDQAGGKKTDGEDGGTRRDGWIGIDAGNRAEVLGRMQVGRHGENWKPVPPTAHSGPPTDPLDKERRPGRRRIAGADRVQGLELVPYRDGTKRGPASLRSDGQVL